MPEILLGHFCIIFLLQNFINFNKVIYISKFKSLRQMVITKEVIEEVKDRLVKVYNPVQIYLFGSYAWGTPNENSDLDLLIVVENSDEKKRHKRGKSGYESLWGLDISKDLLVYTKDELNKLAEGPNPFISKILKNGKLIYVNN